VKLLSPFYSMGQKHSQAIPEVLSILLSDLVSWAGDLSREMRKCGDVIYHWLPTFKDGMCLRISLLWQQTKRSHKHYANVSQRNSTQTAWNASTSAT
jgi:hypothetical protein